MLQQLIQKKSTWLIFSIFIVAGFIFSFNEIVKAAPEVPESAQCTEGNHNFALECEGDPIGIKMSIEERSGSNQCWEACRDAGGASLRYVRERSGGIFGVGGGNPLNWNWYCYGATEEKTCTINIAPGEERTISTTRGILSKEQISDLPEDCGFFGVECHIRGLGKQLASFGGTLIVSVLGIIANVIGIAFSGIAKIFGWVIGNIASIPVSPNNPNTVNIVKDGWGISRDIANMFFIIILSFIGLATILGLESYQAKKTLPRLLIIALLINFSGVLVGFIVDIGNLFANFFLQKAAGLEWSLAWPDTATSGSEISQKAAGYIARIIFYLVASFIYAAIAFLFFIRVFYLWTLAILAPLAFAANILPATKKYWNQWWDELIQWSILAIPMSFFIYLSRLALENTTKTNAIASGAGPIASFMGPFLALFLLFLGITLSSSVAKDTTNSFLRRGKKAGAGLGLAAGAGIWRKLDSNGRISKAGGRLKGFGSPPESAGRIRKALTTGAKWSGARGLTRLAGKGIEFAGKEATMRMGDKDSQEQKAGEDMVGNRDSSSVFNRINMELAKPPGLRNLNKVTGMLNGLIKREDGDDVENAINDGTLKKELIGTAIKTGQRIGPPGFRPLLKSFYGSIMTAPEKYGFDAKVKSEKENYEVITEGPDAGKDADMLAGFKTSIPAKLKVEDFKGDTLAKINFNPEEEAGRYFLKNIVEQRDADFMAAFARRPDKKERDTLVKYIFEEMYGKGNDANGNNITQVALADKAPGALRYITSTTAQNQGIGIDLTADEAKDLIKDAVRKGIVESSKETEGVSVPPPIISSRRRSTGPGEPGSSASDPGTPRPDSGPGKTKSKVSDSDAPRPDSGPGKTKPRVSDSDAPRPDSGPTK